MKKRNQKEQVVIDKYLEQEKAKRVIKLNFSIRNAILLAQLIKDLDFIQYLKQDQDKPIEEIGYDLFDKAVSGTLDQQDKLAELMDKLTGVENSIDTLQIPDIVAEISNDARLEKVKSFFSSAFKQLNPQ